MSRITTTLTGLDAVLALAGIATAQGMDPNAAAVKARQSHMFLNQFSMMTLGGMAQGAIPYNAAQASAAAANLAAVASIDTTAYWRPGTSSAEIEGTRALPAIWDNLDDVAAKAEALSVAAQALAAAAGTDLPSLQAAIGPVGAACGACHEAYRQPE